MIAEKLRKSILQAAIEGKLTEQIPEDEDARDLVETIKKEKEELIKVGKIKKEKPLPEITADEIPFDIPDNWCWVRLGEITTLINGDRSSKYPKEIDYVQDGIPFFGATDMIDSYLSFSKVRYISAEKFHELRSGKLRNNDLVVLLRGSIGKVAKFKSNGKYDTGFINAQMVIIRTWIENDVYSEYLLNLFCSPYFTKFISNVHSGTAVKQLSAKMLSKFIIPLPPRNEVELINLSLSKSYEELGPISIVENKVKELESQFPKKIKNSILQAAMQGKLTEQLPEDGDAHDLLEEIQAEKQSLIAEGKLKKQKNLPPITEEEIPFDIPDNWVWVRLGDCTDIYTGNSIPKLKKELEYKGLDEGYPYIATKDVWLDGTIDYKNGVRIPFDEPKFRIANAGTPLLCIEGGSAGRKIGMLNQDVCFGNKLCNFNPIGYNEKFLFYSLQSSSFLSNFKESMTGIIGGISLKNLKNIIIPLPPTDEQKRIVSKLEKLLS